MLCHGGRLRGVHMYYVVSWREISGVHMYYIRDQRNDSPQNETGTTCSQGGRMYTADICREQKCSTATGLSSEESAFHKGDVDGWLLMMCASRLCSSRLPTHLCTAVAHKLGADLGSAAVPRPPTGASIRCLRRTPAGFRLVASNLTIIRAVPSTPHNSSVIEIM